MGEKYGEDENLIWKESLLMEGEINWNYVLKSRIYILFRACRTEWGNESVWWTRDGGQKNLKMQEAKTLICSKSQSAFNLIQREMHTKWSAGCEKRNSLKKNLTHWGMKKAC